MAISLSACSLSPISEEKNQEPEQENIDSSSNEDTISSNTEDSETVEEKNENDKEKEAIEEENLIEIVKLDDSCSDICTNCEEHVTDKDNLKICGTVPGNVSKITIISKNEEAGVDDTYTLSKFKLGDTNWSNLLQKKYNNYDEGVNTYTIQAFLETGELLAEKTFIINYKKPDYSNVDAKLEIKSPSNLHLDYSNFFYGNTLEISGTTSNNIEKLQIISENQESGLYDDYTLSKFKLGDTSWKTTLKPDFNNMAEGENIYTINAYPVGGGEPITKQFTIKVIYPAQNESIPLPADMGQENSLEVDWYSQPKELDATQFLKDTGRYNKFMYEINRIAFGEVNSLNKNDSTSMPISIWEEGKIDTGHFTGSKLITMKFVNGWDLDGPGAYDQYLRFIVRPNGDLILIEKFSDLEDFPSYMAQALRYEIQRTIKEMNLYNKTISTVSDSGEKMILLGQDNLLEKRKVEDVSVGDVSSEVLFRDSTSGQNVYEDAYGCLVSKNNDSSYSYYTYILNFMSYDGDEYYTGLPDITWTDGTKNTSRYHNAIGDCGQMPCYSFQEFEDESILEKIGTTSSGENVYRIANQGGQVNPTVEDFANRFYEPNNDYSSIDPKQFNDDKGLIFIKNPFGKYISFVKADYEPAMGCGKPVIYLYPEEEGDFEVKVEPNLGITYSDPIYNTGWFVHSDTESNIHNYYDGQEYPYLFWEGDVENYTLPEEGFVFSRKNLEKEMTKKLYLLGLNEKEIADFMEFWYPEMLEENSPYYFVTFMEQVEFDKVAPLEVNPAPDTTIRIFMVYEPLQNQIKVNPLKITTPKRNGFTVVEWGGRIK